MIERQTVVDEGNRTDRRTDKQKIFSKIIWIFELKKSETGITNIFSIIVFTACFFSRNWRFVVLRCETWNSISYNLLSMQVEQSVDHPPSRQDIERNFFLLRPWPNDWWELLRAVSFTIADSLRMRSSILELKKYRKSCVLSWLRKVTEGVNLFQSNTYTINRVILHYKQYFIKSYLGLALLTKWSYF